MVRMYSFVCEEYFLDRASKVERSLGDEVIEETSEAEDISTRAEGSAIQNFRRHEAGCATPL